MVVRLLKPFATLLIIVSNKNKPYTVRVGFWVSNQIVVYIDTIFQLFWLLIMFERSK